MADEEVVIVEDGDAELMQGESLEESVQPEKEDAHFKKIKKALKRFIVPLIAITIILIAVVLIYSI